MIAFSPQAAGWLWKINADGSGLAPVTNKSFDPWRNVSHRWPVFLPDGENFLFTMLTFSSNDDTKGIYVDSLKADPKQLVLSRSNVGYANGYLFYLDDKTSLRAAPFDPAKRALGSDSQVIADQVGYQPSISWGPSPWQRMEPSCTTPRSEPRSRSSPGMTAPAEVAPLHIILNATSGLAK